MTENNPLSKYYRQPQIYITLPSKGRYYPPDVFTPTETGEIPVLPMTAKDEMAFKTPDAMMNGQATVDVIKSCIPNFKDPWKMTNYDTDTVLLAIRIATYGETMDITYTTPVSNESKTTTLNIPSLLESLKNLEIRDEATTSSGFKFKIEPLTYEKLTRIQIAQFEQQKIYSNVADSGLPDSEKNLRFADSYKKINAVNFSLVVESIKEITTPDGDIVNDRKQIADFIDNCDAGTTADIEKKLSELRVQCQIKPIKIKATDEEIKKGVPASYEVPVSFDNSNFFG